MDTRHPEPQTRFRIIAAEAHGWTTLLLEDDAKAAYLYNLDTRGLTVIDREQSARLLTTRAFRPWRGSQIPAPLDRLPLAGTPVAASRSRLSEPRIPADLLVPGGIDAAEPPGH